MKMNKTLLRIFGIFGGLAILCVPASIDSYKEYKSKEQAKIERLEKEEVEREEARIAYENEQEEMKNKPVKSDLEYDAEEAGFDSVEEYKASEQYKIDQDLSDEEVKEKYGIHEDFELNEALDIIDEYIKVNEGNKKQFTAEIECNIIVINCNTYQTLGDLKMAKQALSDNYNNLVLSAVQLEEEANALTDDVEVCVRVTASDGQTFIEVFEGKQTI